MDNTQFDQAFGDILSSQKELIQKYEGVLKAYEKSDVHLENKRLKQELEELKRKYERINQQYDKLKKEAEGLRWSLKEHILNERLSLINSSKKKLDVYFKSAENKATNKILSLEYTVNSELNKIEKIVEGEVEESQKIFSQEIAVLRSRVHRVTTARKNELKGRYDKLSETAERTFGNVREEPLSEEAIQKRIKQNNIEAKIGLQWINKIGILLILIGIVTVMRYSFSHLLGNYGKGIIGLLIGLVFLGGGEWFSRKHKQVFAYGLIGGGIGTLYITLFGSFFILKIMSMPVAAILAVLVSVTTFVLSIRYHSRTISSLGLIGGYLPFLAFASIDAGLTGSAVYIGMFYIFMLNGVTLILSGYKDWSILQYISFASNIPALLYLTFSASDSPAISILYSFLTFGMYLGILLIYPIRFHKPLRVSKVIMLSLNTFISCIVIYLLFEKAQLGDFKGLLALAFCLCYLGLSSLVKKYSPEESSMQFIFGITALTFAILVIPFQFGATYTSIGWLVEGLLLIIYSVKQRNKRLEHAGVIIFALCVFSFYFLDITSHRLFQLKYTLMVLGLSIVLYTYLMQAKKDESFLFTAKKTWLTVYKYFVLFNIWIYLNYIVNWSYNQYLMDSQSIINKDLSQLLLFVIITALLAWAMTHIPLLYDKGIGYVSTCAYLLVDIICIGLNMMPYTLGETSRGLAIVILIVYNILVFFSIKDLIRRVVYKTRSSFELYPLFISLYLIWAITAILSVQFKIAFVSTTMSILYIIAAFVLIVCGFKFRYRLIRYWGLGLSIFSIGKLFLFDFSVLVAIEYKLMSYFSFGVILIAISYVYQRFSKALETSTPVIKKSEEEGE